ncbi:AP2 domain-containing protein [Pseudomonas tremae]|uniref:AP2 domain-containing protein n=1 Tax=Pseudomonas tremae TaxID=200454 RepID=UPI001FA047DA|nr:hypothetical protein [Pseudomonas tremae]
MDHRDGVRSNNAWRNLRLATRAQNSANVPPRGSSGLKGATYNKREQRWKAQICIRGKQTSLGTFQTAEQAHAAYRAAADEYQGQFAHHNSRTA